MSETIIDSKELDQGDEKQKIVLNGLKKSQKSRLLTGVLSGIVGIAGGVGVMSAFSFVSKDDVGNAVKPETTKLEEGSNEADPISPKPIVIYTDAPFASSVTDDMSFNEAFATARGEVGQGGFFEWNGETFNTYYKEEWEVMSKAEQNEFLQSVDENAIEVAEVSNEETLEEDDLVYEEVSEEIIYEITEDDYIEVGDLNEDGRIDIASVNANDNDIPDVVIDIDGDGTMDQLYIDVEVGEQPNNPVNINNNPPLKPHIGNEDLPDPLTDNELNPEIGNNQDMDEYT